MSRTLTDVLVERERLLARCNREREAVAIAYQSLTTPAVGLDRVVAAGRFIVRHPVAAAAITAMLAVLRGRSLFKLAVRGIGLWQFVLRARSFIQLLNR
jgi:hypothetical protein